MSAINEFSDTSARRYSLALYELAEESNVIKEVENHSIAMIKLISESKDFNSLIKDPTNNQNDQLLVQDLQISYLKAKFYLEHCQRLLDNVEQEVLEINFDQELSINEK